MQTNEDGDYDDDDDKKKRGREIREREAAEMSIILFTPKILS